jgi:threonine/homoserine/homoserine lactone efflux protein
MHTQTHRQTHTQAHSIGKRGQTPPFSSAWSALLRGGLAALSSASPWLMALGLCGAYVTIDKPQWVGLNLAFCIGMVVVALLRLWHVLSEPLPGNR